MKENEGHLEGWEQIATLFPLVTTQTVRKKYGKEMLNGGWVFKTKTGHKKAPKIWAFPSMVKKFIAKKQIEQGYV